MVAPTVFCCFLEIECYSGILHGGLTLIEMVGVEDVAERSQTTADERAFLE